MLKTKIIKIDEKNLDAPGELQKLREAAEIIKNGGLVVFPTETVYGLGANALDKSAVSKIYAAKGRPADNPLIVHAANPEDIYKYAEVPEIAGEIIKKFMPAPLTLVLKKKDKSFDAASPVLDTVALRVPKSKTARKLIELAGLPVAAPSANLSGRPSYTDAGHMIADLNGRVELIICGENCEIGLESTVIAFNENNINILRHGYITREMLNTVGDGVLDVPFNTTSAPPPSPGMKYTHYSPDAPLYILSGSEEKIIEFITKEIRRNTKKIGFLCYDEIAGYFACTVISHGPKNDLEEYARNLFGALNKFNALGVDIIYAVEPERVGIGEAIYDRLIKAAGGKVVKV